jgi:hypothetical protein
VFLLLDQFIEFLLEAVYFIVDVVTTIFDFLGAIFG